MEFWGHSENRAGQPERLKDHLSFTARRAKSLATPLGFDVAAESAGLLHDLGKYADQFQDRVRGRPSQAKDHWSAGAAVMVSCFRERGQAPALAIQGHHLGLPDLPPTWQEYQKALNRLVRDQPELLTDGDLRLLMHRWQADGFCLPREPQACDALTILPGAVGMLDVRMLFSTLVDADFVETEAHFNGDANCIRRYRPDGPALDAAIAFQRVEERISSLTGGTDPNDPVQQVRDSLWNACLEAAIQTPGLFTLTAPTGAGKTLAMLGFALRHVREHAEAHGLRRVILVMPFLNIIEQTAKQYRELFTAGAGFAGNFVLEDHSQANEEPRDVDGNGHSDSVDESARARRLLAENWDAPIILTSHVKCLESLMAHNPSRCRKLHRLARSVILFDEVQTLPPKFAVATLATLARLADPAGPYKCSVLFATATQPAFDHLDRRVRELNPLGWRPVEITPKAERRRMFDVAGSRVHVRWRHETPITIDALAAELGNHASEQVLCIVNLKRDAAALAQRLHDRGCGNVQHLSTSLCPQHRGRVLGAVETALEPQQSQSLRLIATQCVEAGVDLDFPVVYRAIAPLDAIAQAAGRCNRHGAGPQRGQVNVINLDHGDGKAEFPPGYSEAVAATRTLLATLGNEHGDLDAMEILNDPEQLRRYYQTLYSLTGRDAGDRSDERELLEAIQGGQFAEADRLYRLIDTETINVLVPYDRKMFDALVAEMDGDQPRTPESVRQWIRHARPITVGIYQPRDASAAWSVLGRLWFSRKRRVEQAPADWWYLLPEGNYRPLLGLELPEEMQCVI